VWTCAPGALYATLTTVQGILYALLTLASSTLWGVLNGWLLYFYLPPGGTPRTPVALYGLVMLMARLVNMAITLPVGYLSDRTRTRWGRRLPYVYVGVVCMPLFFGLLWYPPLPGESLWNLIYLAGVMIAFNVAYECYQTPYDTLLPELFPQEAQRIRVSAWQTGFQLLGAVLSGLAGPLIEALGYGRAAQAYALGLLPVFLTPLFFLRERARSQAAPAAITFRQSLRLALGYRPFQIFTLSWALFWMATTFILETMPYIVTEVCRRSEGDAAYFYLPTVLVSLLCLPLVTRLADRLGKRRLFLASLLAGALTLPGLLWIDPTLPLPLLAQGVGWVVLTAVVLSPAQVLPSAIAAEITDWDAQRSGQRREGMFYAFWGLLDQLASGLGLAVIPLFLLLGRSAASPHGPLGVRLLGAFGGLLLFLAFLIFRRYPAAAPA